MTDGERADWVIDPRGLIKKATLTFAAKFFWLLARHMLSPTQEDNVVTWDVEALVAALEVGLEIDFARVLILVIHERDFKTSTTYPFAYLTFQLAGMPECQFGTVTHSAT